MLDLGPQLSKSVEFQGSCWVDRAVHFNERLQQLSNRLEMQCILVHFVGGQAGDAAELVEQARI